MVLVLRGLRHKYEDGWQDVKKICYGPNFPLDCDELFKECVKHLLNPGKAGHDLETLKEWAVYGAYDEYQLAMRVSYKGRPVHNIIMNHEQLKDSVDFFDQEHQ